MGFINADTILVGHGLENDLRALNLIHATILDTAVVFPHYHGLPFRRSLRSLVSSYLKRDIQVTDTDRKTSNNKWIPLIVVRPLYNPLILWHNNQQL